LAKIALAIAKIIWPSAVMIKSGYKTVNASSIGIYPVNENGDAVTKSELFSRWLTAVSDCAIHPAVS
jgi:hypothetical protein